MAASERDMRRAFRRLPALAGTMVILAATPLLAPAAELSLDDFAPPISGGSTRVNAPVEKKGEVLKAETAQDGLNYAYKALMDKGRDGVEEIVVPSGMAVLSLASDSYTAYDNRNATLLSKRAAYTRAFVKAKKQLVTEFEGIEQSCETAVKTGLTSIDSGSDEGQANSTGSTSEKCGEVVKGMLRGYVTYAIDDQTEKKRVVVSIATSTKTRTAVQQISEAVIVTTDIKRMWENIVAEISRGAMPPAGARMITNPDNGETVIIGFGSAIVRRNRDANMARKLEEAATRQAQMRANGSLIGFLKGDSVYWEGRFEEETDEKGQQFQVTPTGSIEVFDKTKNSFLNTMKMSDDFRVSTSGKVPPGVKQKSFVDQSGDWAVAISVYSKSMTARAEQAGRENRGGVGGPAPPPPSGRKMRMDGGVNEGAENPKGPSGTVSKDSDL